MGTSLISMLRIYFIVGLVSMVLIKSYGQKSGINHDPNPQGKGQRPYEMKDRIEEREPIITFEDCSKWTVETAGCEASLHRSNDQLLYRDYVGKLTYASTDKKSEIILRPEKPIEFRDDWDCINFWHYGAAWNWIPEEAKRAFRVYALVEDGNGKVHPINFVQKGDDRLVHKYWFMNHIKIPDDFPRPLKFTGIHFRGYDVTEDESLSIYLGPLYAYQEELKPLSFETYPEKLPFPQRKETILPINKNSDFTNSYHDTVEFVEFKYQGADTKLIYRLKFDENFPLNVSLINDENEIDLFRQSELLFAEQSEVNWVLSKKLWRNDTLYVSASAVLSDKEIPFSFYYTINQKSLVIGMNELSDEGHVRKIKLGKTGPISDGKLFRIPFLNFDYKMAPRLLYGDGLFFFMQFDWYYSDASAFIDEFPEVNEQYAVHNGGVTYTPMTNGRLNPLKERLFINISPDVHEVFPTIDNPKSPMSSAQANRLWRINGDPDHENLKNEAKKLRSLGIENLTIRYHEGIWRDGGESYTFRLDAAPGRGGNEAVKDLVSYIKSKDWRVGLYSNYTDYAPVNANWNEDWVQQGPKGEWQVSWARCFAPKPMKSLEVQRKFAPKIYAQFGTNHSYCDVHTAITPMSRVDYDYRVPGAGTFRRTFECYGQILLNEKKAYNGPVYSEGGNHWWYAGLVDGNYANAYPSLKDQPIFPDFHLKKIHPLEMDAGNVHVKDRAYLAYTLAHGNIGICDGTEDEMMKRYYMLQPLQEHYSMVPVKRIMYEHKGAYFDASEALVKGYNQEARLKIEYESGFVTYANFSKIPWILSETNEDIVLPEFGIFANTKDGKHWAISGTIGQREVDYDLMHSPGMHYLDSRGKHVQAPTLSGKGAVALKKEKFGWEIIPARDFELVEFNLTLLDIDSENIRIVGVDEDDLSVEEVSFYLYEGRVKLNHENKQIWKYRIIPAVK